MKRFETLKDLGFKKSKKFGDWDNDAFDTLMLLNESALVKIKIPTDTALRVHALGFMRRMKYLTNLNWTREGDFYIVCLEDDEFLTGGSKKRWMRRYYGFIQNKEDKKVVVDIYKEFINQILEDDVDDAEKFYEFTQNNINRELILSDYIKQFDFDDLPDDVQLNSDLDNAEELVTTYKKSLKFGDVPVKFMLQVYKSQGQTP